MEPVIIICVIVVVLFAAIMAILSRYRKCPSVARHAKSEKRKNAE